MTPITGMKPALVAKERKKFNSSSEKVFKKRSRCNELPHMFNAFNCFPELTTVDTALIVSNMSDSRARWPRRINWTYQP